MTGHFEPLYLAQQGLNALQVSAFYLLIAVAYVLFHGIAGRFNLAFGALSMWAGYITVAGLAGASTGALPVVLIVLLAGLYAATATGVLGAWIGRVVAAPLIRQPPLSMLIATIGVAICLEEVMRIAADSRELWVMPLLATPLFRFSQGGFTIQVTAMQGLVFGLCLALAVGLVAVIERTSFGRLWRACAQDIRMAELLGVDTARVFALTALLSSFYAGAAGALIGAYYGSASFYVGFMIGMKALYVAILGGLDSIRGCFVGALFLGTFESFWSAWFPGDFRDVAVFAVMTGILVLRSPGELDRSGAVRPG